MLQRTKLLKWLLARVRRRASDTNKQYAAELLAILMQVGGDAAPWWGLTPLLPGCRLHVCPPPCPTSC